MLQVLQLLLGKLAQPHVPTILIGHSRGSWGPSTSSLEDRCTMTRQREKVGPGSAWVAGPFLFVCNYCSAPSTGASLYRAYQLVCHPFLFNRLGSIQISCSIGQIVCQVADPDLSLAWYQACVGFPLGSLVPR